MQRKVFTNDILMMIVRKSLYINNNMYQEDVSCEAAQCEVVSRPQNVLILIVNLSLPLLLHPLDYNKVGGGVPKVVF